MPRGVKFVQIASQDLEHIYAYIFDQLFDNQAAKTILDKIEVRILRLAEFPLSGSHVEDIYLSSKGYRKLVVDNYIIFYLVDESNKQVVIMRILFGAQNYQDFL